MFDFKKQQNALIVVPSAYRNSILGKQVNRSSINTALHHQARKCGYMPTPRTENFPLSEPTRNLLLLQ
jgi:hypothetical protein